MTVELREVTKENVTAICKLQVAAGQEQFVAPTAVTLAEAQFEETAIVRAIYAVGEPVGLIAVLCDGDGWFVWRLSVDARRQGKGYGRAALEQVFDMLRDKGAAEVLTCYVPGEGSPAAFYAKLGFEETGDEFEGERIARRGL